MSEVITRLEYSTALLERLKFRLDDSIRRLELATNLSRHTLIAMLSGRSTSVDAEDAIVKAAKRVMRQEELKRFKVKIVNEEGNVQVLHDDDYEGVVTMDKQHKEEQDKTTINVGPYHGVVLLDSVPVEDRNQEKAQEQPAQPPQTVEDHTGEKYCQKHGGWKKFSEFYRNNSARDGMMTYCKTCIDAYRTNRLVKQETVTFPDPAAVEVTTMPLPVSATVVASSEPTLPTPMPTQPIVGTRAESLMNFAIHMEELERENAELREANKTLHSRIDQLTDYLKSVVAGMQNIIGGE